MRQSGELKKTGKLRRGFTTGSSSAAGAKAAATALFASFQKKKALPKSVRITLPRGGELVIPVKSVKVSKGSARAVVIKDAGDDPDVTNGAEFVAEVELLGLNRSRTSIVLKGGEGVGVVTRPGLKVAPGRPAINPVPQGMIRTAIKEAAKEAGLTPSVAVTISVPEGKELALKTMNPRLGIVGGISILGTTGIVEPMSLEAYRHSISCGVDVALAAGLDEVVFSTGRSSEKALEKLLKLPEVAYILTGDHMGYALKDTSGRKRLKRVTIAGQFGKFSKLAAGHFETHCSDSSVELDFIAGLSKECGAGEAVIKKIISANTAREVFFVLKEEGLTKVLDRVCALVKENSKRSARSGLEINAILAGYEGEIVCAK